MGAASESFDCVCSPSQAPADDTANYDQLSFGQLHELGKQRGYHKEDTNAVHKIRLGAMDAAAKKPAEGSSSDMETSMTVLG